MKNNKRRLLKTIASAPYLFTLGAPYFHPGSVFATNSRNSRILVILELSGGNDGLNTLIPFGDDAYYNHRPNIAIQEKQVRKIDNHFGFNPGMSGFEKLYKDGNMAIIHGCGYDQPSFSHFTSMAYWHTAAPNSGEQLGWIGRLADEIQRNNSFSTIINIDSEQSLACKAKTVVPVVFDNPSTFLRKGLFQQKALLDQKSKSKLCLSDACNFLSDIARSARDASDIVRDAWSLYETSVDYGIDPLDLNKIASLISYGLDTPLYYTSFRNNAFDTHVQQNNLHRRLLTYASDAVYGFFKDLERIGRADDVTMLVFSEFGRRVPENTSLGTDHGTANHVYLIGKSIKGGHYGEPPSLTQLDDGDNFEHTTDFRRVYATLIEKWIGFENSEKILREKFSLLPVFA